MSLLDEIPGYAEAVNSEQVARELAFLPAPLPICGVPIRHMNARHFILLRGCRNRFLTGGRPQPGDLVGFLWFLSPEYRIEPGYREAFAVERVNMLNEMDLARAIYDYLRAVWQDAPAGGGETGKQYTAPVAWLVDVLAHEYGWAEEAVLEMPLSRAFQYLRVIEMRSNPRKPQFNASDRLVSEHLLKRCGSN